MTRADRATSAAPAPWRVVSSRRIVADRWIDLRADTCVDGRGRVVEPYYVLDPADWVTVVAIDVAGLAIVLEEYRHGAGIVAPGLVGGAVDAGELPVAAAERELREETGYAPAQLIDLGWTWANWGNHTNRSHHFLALGCHRVTEQSLDDTEQITVDLAELDTLGDRLAQSYHLLAWYKAIQHLRAKASTKRDARIV